MTWHIYMADDGKTIVEATAETSDAARTELEATIATHLAGSSAAVASTAVRRWLPSRPLRVRLGPILITADQDAAPKRKPKTTRKAA